MPQIVNSVSYFAPGGNSYAPNGVKVIKISVNGDSWLDPSTVKLFFDITNKASTTDALKPLVNGPWGFSSNASSLWGSGVGRYRFLRTPS